MSVVCNFEKTYDLLDKVDDTKWAMNACEEMATNAAEIIDSNYASQGHGNDEYEVRTEQTDNGYSVIAEGYDIGFLEFGAGDFASSSGDVFDEGGYSVEPGSWSKTHQQVYSRLGMWYYGGVPLTGIMPTRGMQRGLDWIIANGDDVLDRKYNEWINAK